MMVKLTDEQILEAQEDVLRISKSGCSLKVGWDEKRIVAILPHNDMKNCNEQWLDDAQRLCDGWNSQAVITKLKAELKQNQEALNNRAMKFVMIEDELAKLKKDNARLIELLTDARDDIADKVYLNSQMLPYRQGRYDASVRQLADIDALLAEIERDK